MFTLWGQKLILAKKNIILYGSSIENESGDSPRFFPFSFCLGLLQVTTNSSFQLISNGRGHLVANKSLKKHQSHLPLG